MTEHTIWGLVHPDGRAVVWDAVGVGSVRSNAGTWFYLSAAPVRALMNPRHLSEARSVNGPEAKALLEDSNSALMSVGRRRN